MSMNKNDNDINLFNEICFNKNIGKIFIKYKNSDDIFCYFNNKQRLIPEKLKSKILPFLGPSNWIDEFDYNGNVCALLSIEIMKFSQNEIIDILYNNKNIIFSELGFKRDIGKIFIYSIETKEIYGYFENHKIIKNIRDNLWTAFEKDSISHKNDFFTYFNGSEVGFAIKLLNLKKFKYPIQLPHFKDKKSNSYDYIDDNLELQFLLNF